MVFRQDHGSNFQFHGVIIPHARTSRILARGASRATIIADGKTAFEHQERTDGHALFGFSNDLSGAEMCFAKRRSHLKPNCLSIFAGIRSGRICSII
mgnify:CR=1 FL=1